MKTILIVDDSPEVRQLFQLILEGEGHEVHLVSSGEEAVAFLQRTKVSLVLSDFEMARGNGLWLLEQIQAWESPPKVIILSGNIHIDGEKFTSRGATAFLRKPFSIKKLLEAIEMTSGGKKLPQKN